MVGEYNSAYFHKLASRLTNDPAEEISGALEDVANKSWQELHDKEVSVLEAKIEDVKVKSQDNKVEYKTQSLPANYESNEYNTASKKEDAEPETEYNLSADSGWHNAKVEFEKQREEEIRASVLKTTPKVTYKDGNARLAAQNYNMVNRFLNFILWDISANGV